MSEALLPAHFRTAVVNLRMYPAGSPMVEKSVGQMVQALEAAFQGTDKVTLSNRQGKIFYLGKEAPDAAALAPLFDEHGLQSLTFTRGLTSQELLKLVALLGRKKLPDGNVSAWLDAQKVEHVQVDKVKVVEIMEGEVVMKKVDSLFDGVKDFPGLVSGLRESYDLMDKMPEERGKAEVQEHMARKLAGMDASLIRDMFENELPKRVEDSGLRNSVLNAMTQDKLRDIFSEIGTWYRQIRSQTSSDFEVVDHLNKLKSFLGKILTAPGSKKIPFAIYEELLNQGLLDEIPPDVQKEGDESVAAQVDKLLEKPASGLLEQPVRDQLPFLLKKLCGLELDDITRKLLEKFVENTAQGTPLLRQMAAATSKDLLQILWANRKEKLFEIVYSAVEQLAEIEKTIDVYREASQVLAWVVSQFILEEHFPGALRALAILRRHYHAEDALAPKKSEFAGQMLQRVADGVMDVLTEDLLSQDKTKKDQAQNVLAHLGEMAVPLFLNMVKKAEDIRHRRLAAQALKYYGEAAKRKLAAEFHMGNSTPVLLNVLSVLDDFLSPELAGQFEPFLHYPDPAIRRRIIQLLGRMSHPKTAELLVRFLDDGDEGSQIEAIRAVGDTKNQAAVLKLIELLRGGSTPRLEEVCLALGKTGNDQAVPALSELLEPKGGLFKKRSAVEETVRVRAAWALAQISATTAREALSRLTKDPNLQIQSIARQSLESRTI